MFIMLGSAIVYKGNQAFVTEMEAKFSENTSKTTRKTAFSNFYSALFNRFAGCNSHS